MKVAKKRTRWNKYLAQEVPFVTSQRAAIGKQKLLLMNFKLRVCCSIFH